MIKALTWFIVESVFSDQPRSRAPIVTMNNLELEEAFEEIVKNLDLKF